MEARRIWQASKGRLEGKACPMLLSILIFLNSLEIVIAKRKKNERRDGGVEKGGIVVAK